MRPANLLLGLICALAAATLVVHIWLPVFVWLTLPAWSCLALISVADMLLSVRARRLEVDVDMPAKGYVGHVMDVTISLRARRGALPKGLRARLDLPAELTQSGAELAPAAQGSDAASMQFIARPTLRRRGTFTITALWLGWYSRLGLFEIISKTVLGRQVAVLPDISPVLNGALHSQMQLFENGQNDVWLRGEGSDFHQLREFAPGMDTRSIDWKRSARMHDLVVRETRAERNQQIILCLDRGRLMMEDIGGMTRLDRSINAALSMCWAAGAAGDLVGLYSFNSRPRQFVPAIPGRTAFQKLQLLSAEMDYERHDTNHTLGLTHLSGRLKRRSLLLIFSDFADSISAELMVENISILARHHLILFITLRDPELNRLVEPSGWDMDAVARSVSARALLAERRLVMDRLSRLGVLCLESSADQLTSNLVNRYLAIKSREVL